MLNVYVAVNGENWITKIFILLSLSIEIDLFASEIPCHHFHVLESIFAIASLY